VVAADKAFFKSNLDGFEFSMGLTMLGAAGPYFKIPDLRPTSRNGVSGKFAVSGRCEKIEKQTWSKFGL
jgi:hypothetical protein